MYLEVYESPIGTLYISADDNYLLSVTMDKSDLTINANDITQNTIKQLIAYFNHEIDHFVLPLIFNQTEFSNQVLKELANVAYGTQISYAELAERSQRFKAVRAVGSICNKNPYLIIVPCHRIVKSNGEIGAYAYGSSIKQWLLDHEQKFI